MLPEMERKMENVILTRVKTTQESESESSDSDGENAYVKESFEVLYLPEEDIPSNT